MAKRRKTNTNRKKHSQDGASGSDGFLNNIQDGVSLPTISELTSEQSEVEKSNSFENTSFDGTLTGVKIDRDNISTDLTPTQIKLADSPPNNQTKEELMDNIQEEPTENEITLGSYFKNERLKKGISLKVVSQNTKISNTNLEYLESDNFTNLPNKTYVFGYVKSYARTLGLDQEFSLDLARKHYDSDKNPVILGSHLSPINETKQPLNLKFILFFIFFIGITTTLFIYTRTNQNTEVVEAPVTTPAIKVVTSQTPLKTEALTESTSVENETPIQEKVEVNKVEVEPKEKIEVKTTTKPIITKTAPEKIKVVSEKKEKTADKKKEKSNDEIEFTPITGNLYSLNTKMSAEKIERMIPDRFKHAIIAGYQNIYIKASKGSSWLTYKSDEKPIKKFILKEGRNLLIRGKEVRLFLGNINAIEIFLNNKPITLSSASGVKSLVFPQENGTKYKLPLFIYKKDGTVNTSDHY